MERRVLIAVFLSFLVLYVYQSFFVPPPPQNAPSQPSASQPATTSPATPAASQPAETAPPAEAPVALVGGESTEREITVDTNTVQAVLSNRGGRVIHWRLKDYAGDNGQPVDLVPSNVPADQPRRSRCALMTRRFPDVSTAPSTR